MRWDAQNVRRDDDMWPSSSQLGLDSTCLQVTAIRTGSMLYWTGAILNRYLYFTDSVMCQSLSCES